MRPLHLCGDPSLVLATSGLRHMKLSTNQGPVSTAVMTPELRRKVWDPDASGFTLESRPRCGSQMHLEFSPAPTHTC